MWTHLINRLHERYVHGAKEKAEFHSGVQGRGGPKPLHGTFAAANPSPPYEPPDRVHPAGQSHVLGKNWGPVDSPVHASLVARFESLDTVAEHTP